jgi:hypothetical protein
VRSKPATARFRYSIGTQFQVRPESVSSPHEIDFENVYESPSMVAPKRLVVWNCRPS